MKNRIKKEGNEKRLELFQHNDFDEKTVAQVSRKKQRKIKKEKIRKLDYPKKQRKEEEKKRKKKKNKVKKETMF